MIKKRGITEVILIYISISAVLAIIVMLLLGFLFDFEENIQGVLRLAFTAFFIVIIASVFVKKALSPIKDILEATEEISKGNFNIRTRVVGIKELEKLSNSFNKMAKELSYVQTLRTDFINNFSHEFKTPIQSIQGFADILLENGLEEEEKKEYLKIIKEETDRLVGMSTNILNLSKYEASEIFINKSNVNIGELIRKCVILLEHKSNDKNISFNLSLENVVLETDKDLLKQVVTNLLDNAIKFSNDDSEINIRLYVFHNLIKIEVEDFGCGIPYNVIENIFDKFYQVDTSHKQNGNGLGLAIVKGIVNILGGNISASSSLGTGSIFVVNLPKQL
ncbi:MAG: HAMP domain-containing histidine kinase [Defluviitaleaceae bacterium]|nr:HAMP domain-containing histidine kinase [Defluviitaleaceae bacterium]